MRRALVLLLLAVALLAAGCGTKTVTTTGPNGQATTQTVENIHFANTKFLLHAGLAFGAFHRYIYKPLRYGTRHRIAAMAKAALAGAFIVHELRIARQDALSSNQLRPLLAKLDNLEARIRGLIPGLRNGTASSAQVNSASSATDAVGSASSGLGFHIKDIEHSLA
jgi:predicted small secreted protein